MLNTQHLTNLQQRALDIHDNLDLIALAKENFKRDRREYFLNISYPSLQVMQPIDPVSIFDAAENSDQSEVRKVAVYVHIPFCTANCHYCHYFKTFNKPESYVNTYLDSLEREVAMYAGMLGNLHAGSVYIGGGTPSFLSPGQIRQLFLILNKYVTIPEGTEISFEVHPENADTALFQVLMEVGVNRINIGVETFDDKILAQERRRHTVLQAVDAYDLAIHHGFDNINLDFIYGLKGQTLDIWEENLHYIAELQPASACMYYLRLKRGTSEYKAFQHYPELFPTEDELLLMHIMSFESMDDLGYRQDTVDWFIRENRYFHVYQDQNWQKTDRTELLGLGASAYSYINGIQYYNINDVDIYNTQLHSGTWPIWKGECLSSKDERMRRALMLGLKSRVSRTYFRDVFGVDVVKQFPETFEKLSRLELLHIGPEFLNLTYTGKLFADEVGKEFYSAAMKRRMNDVPPELISTTFKFLNPSEMESA